MSADEWKPQACPIARDQRHGYKHWHTDECELANEEQILRDLAERAAMRQRRRNQILRGVFAIGGAGFITAASVVAHKPLVGYLNGAGIAFLMVLLTFKP